VVAVSLINRVESAYCFHSEIAHIAVQD